MTKKQSTRFELRLGLVHLVTVVGAVMGSIVCSFLLGFFAGQHSGFEGALAANIATQAKLPISPTEAKQDEVERAISEEVLEKLSGDIHSAAADSELPTVGAVTEMHRDDIIAFNDSSETRAVANEGAIGGESLSMNSVFPGRDEPEQEGGGIQVVDAPVKGVQQAANLKQQAAAPSLGDTVTGNSEVWRSPRDAQLALRRNDVVEPKREVTANAKASPAQPDPTRAKLGMPEAARSVVQEKESPTKTREDSGFVRSVIPPGWFAQVAAPRKLRDADTLAQRLRGSGFPVVIETATVRGQDYFRVLVGPEENRRQAQVLVDQLRRESYIPAEPFLRLVR